MVSHKYKLMWKICGYYSTSQSELKNKKVNPRDYRYNTKVRKLISSFKTAVVKQTLGSDNGKGG